MTRQPLELRSHGDVGDAELRRLGDRLAGLAQPLEMQREKLVASPASMMIR